MQAHNTQSTNYMEPEYAQIQDNADGITQNTLVFTDCTNKEHWHDAPPRSGWATAATQNFASFSFTFLWVVLESLPQFIESNKRVCKGLLHSTP